MNTINFKQGINLVCLNKNDSFTKILDSINSKITTISSLKNNEIKSSVYIDIGGVRTLIGNLQQADFNSAYYITCNDSITLSYAKTYLPKINLKLDAGNNLIGFSNSENIDVEKVINYPEINTISCLEGNTINASININANFIGDIKSIKQNKGYIINTTDSITIDIYKYDNINLSVQYTNAVDSVTLKIYKINAKISNTALVTESNQNLYLTQALDSSIFNFSLPHGIYNITFFVDCEHSSCGTNYGNYKINIGDSTIVNQNNFTKENTTTLFCRYDYTCLHSSLTYEDYIINMEDKMKNINALFPDITKYYSIGKSQDGVYDLWVMEVSGDINKITDKPYLRYISNMHGNEPSGRALLIWFIEWLCDEYYEGNTRVVNLLNNSTVQILPTMNPWGFYQSPRIRYNSRNYDLNRNFPDQYIPNNTSIYEAETNSVMIWNANNPQVILSANFHEGAKIISYPYDGDGNLIPGISGTENNTVDNDIYKILAKKYSQNMFPKLTYLNSVPSKDFGIINGADWYTLYGGMQDWEYLTYNILSCTIEVSVTKNTDPQYLDDLKIENLSSDGKTIDGGGMLGYLEGGFQGIHGHVLDTSGNPIINATIQLYQNGSEYGSLVKSKEKGDFYKLVPYGSYIIKIEKTGYDNYVNGIFVTEIGYDISLVTNMIATLVTS
jgi:carboxypeptidase D